MIKHTAIKAGVAIGLMAASLGASSADLHTFAGTSIYYKLNGAAINYTAFLASGLAASDSVIMLDVLQSGTVSTWAYGIGGVIGAGQTPITNTLSALFGNTSMSSSPAGGIGLRATGVITYITPAGTSGSTTSTSFYNGDTQSLKLSFTMQPTVSSQACNMSFSAVMDTDDYLQFTSLSVQPSNWPSATGDVYYRISSGTSVSNSASIASNVFNAYNASATSSFYTFSAWTIPIAAGAGNTVAVSLLSVPFNKCVTAYTNRTASNSAGNVIGGKGGMMRLW
ncbi:MAG: hypothetical protein WC091_23710 [Sulfuricellaceae bacterium]